MCWVSRRSFGCRENVKLAVQWLFLALRLGGGGDVRLRLAGIDEPGAAEELLNAERNRKIGPKLARNPILIRESRSRVAF